MRTALLVLLSGGLLHPVLGEPKPWEDPDRWIQAQGGNQLAELRQLEDVALRRHLAAVFANRAAEGLQKYNAALCEIARREGRDWEAHLNDILETKRSARSVGGARATRIEQQQELEVLTVLRRLQGQPSPLRIEVRPLLNAQWEFPVLPSVEISVTKHPAETEDVLFQFDGNYRSGRQGRWAVLAWDAAGKLVARRTASSSGFGGGVFRFGDLGGESWETDIALSSFLYGPVAPGRYWACLAYHNVETIADCEDLAGLVLHYSEPFEFEVLARVVNPLPVPAEELQALVRALPEAGAVKILKATYGKGAHDFIASESSAGQLLSLGWPVVADLHDELLRPELTVTQRAWGLGILHSITGFHDPTRRANVVGEYEWRGGGFFIQNRVNGNPGVASFGTGASGSSRGGKADEEAQLALLEEWRGVLECLIRDE